MKIAIIYHSGFGHTQALVSHIKDGIESGDVKCDVFKVEDLSESLSELADYSGFVFGSPTYMGDVSSKFKKFMEDSVKIWFARGWKDKLAGGFSVSGSPDGNKGHSGSTLTQFALGHGMVWVGVEEIPTSYVDKSLKTFDNKSRNRAGVYNILVAQAENAEVSESNPPKGDRDTAYNYGVRLAYFCKKLS